MKSFNEIDGYSFGEECEKLAELSRGKVCLELGAFKGRTTVAMASTAKRVHTIDTFNAGEDGQEQKNRTTTLNEFKENISGYKNIKYYVGDRKEYIDKFKLKYFDLIFVDSDHTYKSVKEDIQLCLPRLKPGGMIVFHDYTIDNYPGVRLAVDEYFKEYDGLVRSMVWITV